MIVLQFPKINKALMTNTKDLPEDDPRHGIIVMDNRAIVLSNTFILVCNLYDYFTIEAGIEEPDEIEELERILFYMDRKVFGKDFWVELTKGSGMKIKEGALYLENPKYSKDLYEKDLKLDFLEPLNILSNLNNQGVGTVDSVAVPFGALKSIYDCLPSDFKTDFLVFEFTGQDMPVPFTFRKRKHFYGCLFPHYDAAVEGFKFEDLQEFVSNISGELEELKNKAIEESKAPPPPPVPEEKKDPNQLEIV